MDGLKYVKPMSCRQPKKKTLSVSKNQTTLLPAVKTQKPYIECEGCRTNNPFKHSGEYARIMDWKKNKSIKFTELISEDVMKR